jgi:S1-C subfamily serine protease
VIRKLFLTVAIVAAGFAGGLAITDWAYSNKDSGTVAAAPVPAPASEQRTEPTTAQPPAQLPPPPLAGMSGAQDFTKIAAEGIKGVANISSLQVVRRPNSPFSDDPFFQYFFGDQDLNGSRDRRSLSLGSGVLVSPDGYIVTNNHVVGDNVREITVAFGDKREVAGKVIGTDPATDIALLKVDVKGLPSLRWADSSKLQVGLHPDRRGDQPGELRRRAHQHAGRTGGNQHRHLQPERRLPGHRVRRPQQPGAPCR